MGQSWRHGGRKNGRRNLASGHIRVGPARSRYLFRVYQSLREHLEEALMTYLTAVIAVFVFGYLVTAMIRPEWF